MSILNQTLYCFIDPKYETRTVSFCAYDSYMCEENKMARSVKFEKMITDVEGSYLKIHNDESSSLNVKNGVFMDFYIRYGKKGETRDLLELKKDGTMEEIEEIEDVEWDPFHLDLVVGSFSAVWENTAKIVNHHFWGVKNFSEEFEFKEKLRDLFNIEVWYNRLEDYIVGAFKMTNTYDPKFDGIDIVKLSDACRSSNDFVQKLIKSL